jgi:hypothetical protein
MPRRPRIEINGYYHIINRGVEQRTLFKEPADFAYFEELMCFYAKSTWGLLKLLGKGAKEGYKAHKKFQREGGYEKLKKEFGM